MPFVIADRVRETTTTTGTGAVTLAGAYTSFQTFSAAIGNGNNTYYTIASAVSGEWEVGIGTYTSAGNTLSRDTVLASSNAGALVVFSAGTKDVFVTQPASRAIFVQNGGTGLQTSNSAFTANRVLYANAATTTATSANLTFDGTNLGVGVTPSAWSGVGAALQVGLSAAIIGNSASSSSFISNAYFDGTNYRYIGTGFAQRLALTSGAYSFQTAASGTAGSAVTFTTGMTLDASGNLGVGTTSPSNRLDVFASADWQGRVVGNAGFNGGLIVEGNATGTRAQINLKTNNGTAREYYLRNVSGTFSLLDNTAGTIPFTVEAATPSNTIYANASGNLGIGTASPSNTAGFSRQLQIEGTTAALTLSGTTGTGKYTLGVPGVNAVGLWDNTASAYRWYVDSSGNLGIGTTSPSDILTLAGGASGSYGLTINNAKVGGGTKAIFQYDATNQIALVGGNTTNGLAFQTLTAGSLTTKAVIDASGNLGLGVTPSAWGSGWTAFQLSASGAALSGRGSTSEVYLSSNAHYNGSNWIYKLSATAAYYGQDAGVHKWYTAASGTAGTAISFTQAMTLDASGNLGIGTTSPAARLDIVGDATPAGTGLAFGHANTAGYKWIQSFASQPLYINPLGNNTIFNRDGGNLGIGTTSPGYPLSVVNAANGVISVKGGSATNQGGAYRVEAAGSTGTFAAFGDRARLFGGTPDQLTSIFTGSTSLTFDVNGSEQMRLTTGGNLGIGYSSPAYRLQLAGTLGFRANSTNIPGLFGSGFGYSVSSYPAVVMGDGSGTQSICLNYDPVVNLSGQFSGNGSEIVVRNIAQFIQPDSGNTTFRRYVLTLNDGNVGIGTLSPGCRLQVTQAASAALGAQIALHNNASSAVGNTVEISFLTDSGASPSGTRNGRIRAVNENASNGAANMQFWTWNGSSDAERMRLTSTGLGITEGNSPTQVLSLYRSGSSAQYMSVGNSNTGLNGTLFGIDGSGNTAINNTQNLAMLFLTNNTERARITNGGEFLVNTTNSYGSHKLSVVNTTRVAAFSTNSSTGSQDAINVANIANAGYNAVRFWNQAIDVGTVIGTIACTTTATAYNTSSDRRLKENIVSSDDASAIIDAIEVVKHDWKSGGHVRYGVIAQDLYEVAPEAVTVGDAEDVEDFKNPWAVDYSKLVPMLVKEIQSLRQRVAQLESK